MEYYLTRKEMNKDCDKEMVILSNNLDICAFGLRSFRDAKKEMIEDKVKKGLKIRILTIHPDSDILEQRERDENVEIGSIRKSIFDLCKWMIRLHSIAVDNGHSKDNIAIKLYHAIPLDFHFRMDDTLFVGAYMHGRDGQDSVSFKYTKGSELYDFYTNYFEELWNDKIFCA